MGMLMAHSLTEGVIEFEEMLGFPRICLTARRNLRYLTE